MAFTPITVFPVGALGADYLNPVYGPAAHTAGARVHFRYLKNLTVAEVQAGHARGDGYVAICERGANDPTLGALVGLKNGAEAVAQARAIGYPQGCPILIAVDTNPVDLTACEAYFRAAAAQVKQAGFQVGFYGGSRMWFRVRDIVDVKCRAAASSWSPASIVWAPDIVQGVQEPQHRWDWDFLKAPLNVWLPRFVPDAPLPAVPAPTLKQGSRGAQVVGLQQALRFWGWSTGPADGSYGPVTKQGVIVMQRALHVVADGVYGPQTAHAYAVFLAGMAHLAGH